MLVCFFALQIMGIVSSQIEIRRIFNMVGIIKGLKHCHLGIENLEKLVLIMKNLPKIPIARCTISSRVKSMEEYLDFEDYLLEKNIKKLIVDFSLSEED